MNPPAGSDAEDVDDDDALEFCFFAYGFAGIDDAYGLVGGFASFGGAITTLLVVVAAASVLDEDGVEETVDFRLPLKLSFGADIVRCIGGLLVVISLGRRLVGSIDGLWNRRVPMVLDARMYAQGERRNVQQTSNILKPMQSRSPFQQKEPNLFWHTHLKYFHYITPLPSTAFPLGP